MIYDLGVGRLTWDSLERISDRYGTIWLMPEGHDSTTDGSPSSLISAAGAARSLGLVGKLSVKALQVRASTHVGDLFRNIFPSTPKVGESGVLGTGKFFVDANPTGGIRVGVYPLDTREYDWLDPNVLYRFHEQTVELTFETE